MRNLSLLFPSDKEHAVRIRRNAMAALASLLVVLLLFFYYWQGFLPRHAFIQASAAIVFLIGLFYFLFRTGVNKAFRDPSLTLPQMLAAAVVIEYVTYQADNARGGLLLIYLMVFMFGLFRLNMRELLMAALFVVSSNALVIYLLAVNKPYAINLQMEITQCLVLAMVLLWFAPMGGYINHLRDTLRDSNTELQDALEKMHGMATRDELTGIHNRRSIWEILEMEKNRADRGGAIFCVALFDLDHFKSVNDRFGHAAGDKVLKGFTDIVRKELRASDYFGRYGGEEFLLLLPQTTLGTAPAFAERIREFVEKGDWTKVSSNLRLTVSAGIAQYRSPEKMEETLQRADSALYRAKKAGRNRVEYAL
jgi:diguanylate cyclase (GGDEF)-like protein